MAYVVLRRQTKEGVGIDGRSLGNGTAFSAVAPSQRPVYDAHQSKSIMSPRARTSERLTSSRLVSSARTSAFRQPDPHCLAVLPACHIPPGKLPVCFDDLWMHNSS
jgi:hypothetical protein